VTTRRHQTGAGELGMRHEALRNWVRAAERQAWPADGVSSSGGLSVADKDAEIARFRREVAELRQEEILCKAAAISPRRWAGNQPLSVRQPGVHIPGKPHE
jgi:transposase-like protein